MTKKIVSIAILIMMVFAVIATAVQAADEEEMEVVKLANLQEYTYLDVNTPEFVLFKQANSYIAIWTPEEEHESAEYYFNLARKADSNEGWLGSLEDFESKVEFFFGENTTLSNNGSNIGTYQVIQKEDGWYAYSSGNKISNIVLGKGMKQYGSLKVTADVTKQHDKVTIQPIWQKTKQEVWQKTIQPIGQKTYQPVGQREVREVRQRTIQPIWQKTIQPVWQKEIQEEWQKTIQPVWQKEIRPVWQKEIQQYLIPTFEKKVSSVDGTLVTWLDNGNVPGGKFGNKMTWVEVNLEEARQEGGINYTIADSSPSNNPIDYKYNIRIEGDELILTLDDRLISANVTAKLYNSVPSKHDPSNHVTITNGEELRVKLPTTTTTSTKAKGKNKKQNTSTTTTNQDVVYMFVHFDGLKWYTTGEYEFAGWKIDDSRTEIKDYEVENKVEKDYELRKDVISDECVNSYVAKDYELRKDVVSEELVNNRVKDEVVEIEVVSDTERMDLVSDVETKEVVEDKLVRTDEISNEWVRDEKVNTETITDEYNVEFNLEIKDAKGNTVYTGKVANNGEVIIPKLEVGDYTCTLSGNGMETITKNITVEANKEEVVNFEDITIQGDVENVYLDKIYDSDVYLTKTYLDDKYLPKYYNPDIYLDKYYEDDIYLDAVYNEDIYLDKIYLRDKYLDKIYEDDIYLDKIYKDDIYLDKVYEPDIWLDKIYLDDIINTPIKLGNEEDQNGEYAEKLN